MSQIVVQIQTPEASPPQPTDDQPSAPSKRRRLRQCLDFVGDYALFLLFCIVFVPFYLLYAAGAYIVLDIDVTEENSDEAAAPSGGKNFYRNLQEKSRSKANNVAKRLKIIRSRLVTVLLIWLIVNLSVPALRRIFIFGTKLWKWSLLVTMVLCGYILISAVTGPLLETLCSINKVRTNKNAVYYAKGLRRSVNMIVLNGSVLLTWIFYFRTSRGIKKTSETDGILHGLTWTFITLSIGAVLWLLKTVLLLKWEADAVYGRFSERILSLGFQFYFLDHICEWKLGMLRPRSYEEFLKQYEKLDEESAQDQTEDEHLEERVSGDTVDNETKNEEIKERKKTKDTLRFEGREMYKDVTTYEIKLMTKCFMDLSKACSREDDGTSDLEEKCKQIAPHPRSRSGHIKIKDLCNKLDEEDARLLYLKLKSEHPSEDISFEKFQKYMVKAHKNCLALGYTLSDAKAVVNMLDKVMTVLLIAIAIVAWSLLADIVTTKILVLVASPFLAATFVFGDACKRIFEGIIFSFINHPFDVGDRCIINGIELEVKRMSILTTKFVLIGNKEEVLYPNSVLATTSIMNLKGEPDPRDHVELKLDCKCTKSMLVKLQTEISKFFKDDKSQRFKMEHTVVIQEIGNSINVTIQYEHVMSIHEATHSQCHEKKRKQRSHLLLHMMQCMEDAGMTLAADISA